MEGVEDEEDDADGYDHAQDDGVPALPQVDPLHQAVDHGEPV